MGVLCASVHQLAVNIQCSNLQCCLSVNAVLCCSVHVQWQRQAGLLGKSYWICCHDVVRRWAGVNGATAAVLCLCVLCIVILFAVLA